MSFASTQADGALACGLCPHRCLIPEGRFGRCRVRKNASGELDLPFYGVPSSIAADPIEKKPLYHFYPGRQILSIGFFGCNFRCPFCQNHTISQHTKASRRSLSPEDLVSLADEQNSFGIAYTYSEPLVHFEYVIEASRAARGAGLKNVLVTNGFINPEPANELLEVTDAANIDLKAFRDAFYTREIRGSIDPVKAFILQATEMGVHVEVTTLVIPGKNDSADEICEAAEFLAHIDPDIPYHLSCYYPTYEYDIPATRPDEVLRLVEIARERLRYVYPGNVGYRSTDTTCPQCGKLQIRRSGYRTEIVGIESGVCGGCGRSVPIVGLSS